MQKSHFISLFSSNLDLFRQKNCIAFLWIGFCFSNQTKKFPSPVKRKKVFKSVCLINKNLFTVYFWILFCIYLSFFYMFEKGWKGFCDCSAKSTPDFPRLGKISPVVNERRGINGRRGHPPLFTSPYHGPPSPATRLVKRC